MLRALRMHMRVRIAIQMYTKSSHRNRKKDKRGLSFLSKTYQDHGAEREHSTVSSRQILAVGSGGQYAFETLDCTCANHVLLV